MGTGLRLIAATALVLLAGCASISARIVADGDTFVIAAGEAVLLSDGTAVGYQRVLADSRCLPGVQCIWAGRAEVEFSVTPPPDSSGAASATSELRLFTDGDDVVANGNWQFELVKLDFGHLPAATLRVDPRVVTP